MPTVAHSARISSLDLKRGPSDVGFIMRYHSSQTAPGMRPLRGQKSLPYGEELSPIHSSTSRTSSNAMPGLSSAASIVLASIRMSPASGTMEKDAFTVDGIGQVSRRVGVRIPRVDDDTRFFLDEIGKFAGSNQNVRHGRPLLFLGLQSGSNRNPSLLSIARQHLAKLLGGGGDDGDEIGFAEPALGAVALEVAARAAMEHRGLRGG